MPPMSSVSPMRKPLRTTSAMTFDIGRPNLQPIGSSSSCQTTCAPLWVDGARPSIRLATGDNTVAAGLKAALRTKRPGRNCESAMEREQDVLQDTKRESDTQNPVREVIC